MYVTVLSGAYKAYESSSCRPRDVWPLSWRGGPWAVRLPWNPYLVCMLSLVFSPWKQLHPHLPALLPSSLVRISPMLVIAYTISWSLGEYSEMPGEREKMHTDAFRAESRGQGQSQEMSVHPGSGWHSWSMSHKSTAAPRGRHKQLCLYDEGQSEGVTAFPCTPLKMVYFQGVWLCSLCQVPPGKLNGSSKHLVDLNAAALCSAGETLKGHWEPWFLTGRVSDSPSLHWRALGPSGVNHALCRIWPQTSHPGLELYPVGFEFLLLHYSQEEKQKAKTASVMHLPEK